ncbi:hypothetical protein CcCBS67573_g09344 [Chytriomyces confervae]|uniref:Cyclic nucleotide-binding domain-containing protein n=1 Tax=Chytriomyces confervae TaxID=246404 RepID=A0A507DY69_9FUNG|nr:hypothetical protein CcCBS67573_g09344 [Chytriomyces confervae]
MPPCLFCTELSQSLLAEVSDLQTHFQTRLEKVNQNLLNFVQLHSPTTSTEPPRAKKEIAASHLDLGLRWNAGDYAIASTQDSGSERRVSIFSEKPKQQQYQQQQAIRKSHSKQSSFLIMSGGEISSPAQEPSTTTTSAAAWSQQRPVNATLPHGRRATFSSIEHFDAPEDSAASNTPLQQKLIRMIRPRQFADNVEPSRDSKVESSAPESEADKSGPRYASPRRSKSSTGYSAVPDPPSVSRRLNQASTLSTSTGLSRNQTPPKTIEKCSSSIITSPKSGVPSVFGNSAGEDNNNPSSSEKGSDPLSQRFFRRANYSLETIHSNDQDISRAGTTRSSMDGNAPLVVTRSSESGNESESSQMAKAAAAHLARLKSVRRISAAGTSNNQPFNWASMRSANSNDAVDGQESSLLLGNDSLPRDQTAEDVHLHGSIHLEHGDQVGSLAPVSSMRLSQTSVLKPAAPESTHQPNSKEENFQKYVLASSNASNARALLAMPAHPTTRSAVTDTARVSISFMDDSKPMPDGPPPSDTSLLKLSRQIYLVFFLLPAFDNKGRTLRLDQFEQADFDTINFLVNGLHPKSTFSTVWDFFMSGNVTIVFSVDSLVSIITPQSFDLNEMCSFREYESMRPSLRDWLGEWCKYQMIPDILSTVPFEIIFRDKDHSVLFLLLRLLRFIRLPNIITRCAVYRKLKYLLEKQFGMGISRVVPIGGGIYFYMHFNACAMYAVGSLHGFLGWRAIWPEFDRADLVAVYIWTFFQSLGNIFPMSFKPQTMIEQCVAVLFICLGAILYAGFLGTISSAVMSLNPSGRLYNQKVEELLDYVQWKKLDAETSEKLISYYETKYRGKYFEEDSLLAELNESLRADISLHNTRNLIEKVPFLRREEGDGRDEIFFHRIATVLRSCYYIPGDYITKQGDSGLDMFFILSGKVNVFVNGHKVVSLYDGAYIGEVALITKVLRTATVQAAMPTVVYRLSNTDFHTVISEFLDMKLRIEKLAIEGQRVVLATDDGRGSFVNGRRKTFLN